MKTMLRKRLERGLINIMYRQGAWASGFVVEAQYIITNCHCLPRLPDPHMAGDDSIALPIKRLTSKRKEAIAEVVYADPCGDIAVLQLPDCEDEGEAYDKLMEEIEPLQLSPEVLPRMRKDLRVHVRTRRGEWLSGKAFVAGHGGKTLAVTLDDKKARIPGGTSGSPVFTSEGVVVGVLKIGVVTGPAYSALALPDYLPFWLFDRIKNGHGIPVIPIRRTQT